MKPKIFGRVNRDENGKPYANDYPCFECDKPATFKQVEETLGEYRCSHCGHSWLTRINSVEETKIANKQWERIARNPPGW